MPVIFEPEEWEKKTEAFTVKCAPSQLLRWERLFKRKRLACIVRNLLTAEAAAREQGRSLLQTQ